MENTRTWNEHLYCMLHCLLNHCCACSTAIPRFVPASRNHSTVEDSLSSKLIEKPMFCLLCEQHGPLYGNQFQIRIGTSLGKINCVVESLLHTTRIVLSLSILPNLSMLTVSYEMEDAHHSRAKVKKYCSPSCVSFNPPDKKSKSLTIFNLYSFHFH